MTKQNNLHSFFCGILFCITITALIIACLAFTKKGGRGEYYGKGVGHPIGGLRGTPSHDVRGPAPPNPQCLPGGGCVGANPTCATINGNTDRGEAQTSCEEAAGSGCNWINYCDTCSYCCHDLITDCETCNQTKCWPQPEVLKPICDANADGGSVPTSSRCNLPAVCKNCCSTDIQNGPPLTPAGPDACTNCANEFCGPSGDGPVAPVKGTQVFTNQIITLTACSYPCADPTSFCLPHDTWGDYSIFVGNWNNESSDYFDVSETDVPFPGFDTAAIQIIPTHPLSPDKGMSKSTIMRAYTPYYIKQNKNEGDAKYASCACDDKSWCLPPTDTQSTKSPAPNPNHHPVYNSGCGLDPLCIIFIPVGDYEKKLKVGTSQGNPIVNGGTYVVKSHSCESGYPSGQGSGFCLAQGADNNWIACPDNDVYVTPKKAFAKWPGLKLTIWQCSDPSCTSRTSCSCRGGWASDNDPRGKMGPATACISYAPNPI